jgi:hypothetical protein
VGEDGDPQPVALGAGHAVDPQFLVAVGRARGGVDPHPHEAEEPVQRRRLDLDAADPVVGHRPHRPRQQPTRDHDGGGPVGVAEAPPGERRGEQGERGDGEHEPHDGRRPAAEPGGRADRDQGRDELAGLAERDGVDEDDERRGAAAR